VREEGRVSDLGEKKDDSGKEKEAKEAPGCIVGDRWDSRSKEEALVARMVQLDIEHEVWRIKGGAVVRKPFQARENSPWVLLRERMFGDCGAERRVVEVSPLVIPERDPVRLRIGGHGTRRPAC
jgi:hypothetical protein